jgi:NitT/TauT family transport system ATP-binding protein
VTHDLEEAPSLSDDVYLLSRGSRACIAQHYAVPIPRPRNPLHSRTHPRTHPAFAPLYERLWGDLSREVDYHSAAE